MRGFKFAYLGFTALVTTVGATSSCTGPSDDCETHRSCSGGGTSTSGTSGDAGDGNANMGGSVAGKGGAAASGSTSGGKSGSGGSSGTSSGGDGGAGGGSCDTTKSPTEEACLVTDDYAVFVSPDGDDDANDGSQGAPLASLTKAVEVAAGAKLVLVCDATYDEHAVVTVGARVYGGFKCADWTAENAKPLFKPTTSGPALKIDGAEDDVLIEGVSFEVGNATSVGGTALTAIVNASSKVTLRLASFKAGKGTAGADAMNAGFDLASIALAVLSGHDGTAVDGGSGSLYSCPGGAMTKRGSGGAPPDGNGAAGTPAYNGVDGKGGDSTKSCGAGGSGLDGAAAPAAANALGASSLGAISVAGWTPNSGGTALDGAPGQGGGGGAGKVGGGGGSGGAGACGGKGGPGGGGGGGSIALVVIGSSVTFDGSTLTTADAGNGGGGAAGQQGQKVNAVGGDGFGTGCDGGLGGAGGDGGGGGGGAGGISVGIAWKGAMQHAVSADTTITTGKAGMKGSGGVPTMNDGIAGVSQKVLAAN